LYDVTGNIIYKDYVIERIATPLREKSFVKFKNGAVIYEGEQAKDLSVIFGQQLYYLIKTHFEKKEKLKAKDVKCLSLIFIDRVDNYMKAEGIIKLEFEKQFKKAFNEIYGKAPSKDIIDNAQGYYFAQTGKGDYADGEGGLKEQKKLYDLILKDKEELLNINNPVEFIFSHSALGVGWDNPNIFNIATLNQSYSEIKKRQEIGRGLRICVNQNGERVHDSPLTSEGSEINLLTVIPNETYETFVAQYQSEIAEVYGTTEAGAETRNNFKGTKLSEKKIKRNEELYNSKSFREFWKRLAKKTEYLVSFDEERVINESVTALNEITISESKIQFTLGRIQVSDKGEFESSDARHDCIKASVQFAPLDLVEEISENSALAYPTVFKIVSRLENKKEIVKNPPRFLQEAVNRIKNIELEEMVRAVSYHITGETYGLDSFKDVITKNTDKIEATPKRGIYDHIIWDSEIEKEFAKNADTDAEVVCFLKLPSFYVIKTPAGDYNPDFGLVLKRRTIRGDKDSEYYFVIETKGTNDINDRKALTDNEIYKMKCAVKHFEALGIEAKVEYVAPVKDYARVKDKLEN
jgi:type III restriction enzyme